MYKVDEPFCVASQLFTREYLLANGVNYAKSKVQIRLILNEDAVFIDLIRIYHLLERSVAVLPHYDKVVKCVTTDDHKDDDRDERTAEALVL